MPLGNQESWAGNNLSTWTNSIQVSTTFKEFGITTEDKLYAILLVFAFTVIIISLKILLRPRISYGRIPFLAYFWCLAHGTG